MNKLKNSTHHAPANATHAQNISLFFISIHPQIMILVAGRDDSKGNHPNQSGSPNKNHKSHKQNPPMDEARTSRN
jgi:hypothetical protein